MQSMRGICGSKLYQASLIKVEENLWKMIGLRVTTQLITPQDAK